MYVQFARSSDLHTSSCAQHAVAMSRRKSGTNPGSFTTLKNLAAQVRASGTNPDGSRKLWFAPVAPGYDSILNGGSTCVPRNGVQTLDTLWSGNAQSAPDGWTLISWNEISEGSYVQPLQRWGTLYLDELHRLIG